MDDYRRIAQLIRAEAAKSNMLNKTAEEIANSVGQSAGYLVWRDGLAVAFAATIDYGEDKLIEVGSVITDPRYRRKGLATEAATKAVLAAQAKPDRQVVVFANEESQGLFHNLGFRLRPKDQMPHCCIVLCESCDELPRFPSCHCRYMVLDGILVGEATVSIIRSLDQLDLEQAAELFCRAFTEPPWRENWETSEAIEILQSIQAHNHGILLFAIRRGQVVGASGGFPINQEEFSRESSKTGLDGIVDWTTGPFYIDELFVKGEERGRGIGAALTSYLVSEAKRMGYRQFLLRTDTNAHAARAVYAKLGFTDSGISDSRHTTRTYWHL